MFIDFHGSTGYGQAFTDSISQDWGGKPLEDLQRKALPPRCWSLSAGWMARTCALGASYGGYDDQLDRRQLAAEPFKCLVNHDGVFDRARHGLLHRGAVVHGMGARR